ncbi:MAG: lipopolysaccharide heptosyltransferase I [Betaproteobacteria bacterium]|nr:lipopolysaccharide heptosyltransferase I [Betaproteobacteria bacterium]
MLRVLLVKTSSLGDVVHNLPVATDVRRHFPDATIDWVVEEPFVALARMHPAVRRVIPVAVRRWRSQVLGPSTWKELAEFQRLSQAELYDAIIDTQGLLKSTLIARAARGRRHGFDVGSAREPLAARFYDLKHHVARGQHAVVRNRLLAAAALGYRIDTPADFGLRASAGASEAVPASGRRRCAILHGSSRPDKLWPVDSWIVLGGRLDAAGIDCVLPWGSDAERARSEAIAAAVPGAVVPGRMTLDEVAGLLASSAMVVGVDTGITHLAGALGRPVVALFLASDPALTGVYGAPRARNLGHIGAPATPDDVVDALSALQAL